ncbi:MAG: protoporphyrinogen oxidase [Angustibacter sp.]
MTSVEPRTPARDERTVAVVGGGIAGLAAAWQLATSGEAVRVVLLEASPRVGGKLALGELGGTVVDVGAESLLARRPEALQLALEVGLGDALQPPRAVGAGLWSGGGRYPLPRGTLMGVPSSSRGLDGLLPDADRELVEAEPTTSWPPQHDDVDVASFVASRVGQGVVDRLVEPLLGGVYAGHARRLSLQATVPALWQTAVAAGSVVQAAGEAAARGQATQAPVFSGVVGGVGRLPVAVADALRAKGVDLRTRTTVRRLERRGSGWRLVTGPTVDEQVLDVDGVVLAVPAAPASRLLGEVAPRAAAALGEVQYASVALVTLLLDRSAVAGLDGSGLLVPPVDGRYIKATTFASSKWEWLDASDPRHVVVRASVGRFGEERDLQLDDDEIVRRALADLRAIPGVRLPEPVTSLVTRWGGGLPQYDVGHLARVQRVLDGVAELPGLAVAGAAYGGVGVPACVSSGRQAADRVLDETTQVGRPERGGGQSQHD